MANKAVSLYRKCKTAEGWKHNPAVMAANGKVKPNAVLVGGQKAVFPVGHYELRSFNVPRPYGPGLKAGRRMLLPDSGSLRKRAAAKAIAGEAGVQVVQGALRKVLRDEAKR